MFLGTEFNTYSMDPTLQRHT